MTASKSQLKKSTDNTKIVKLERDIDSFNRKLAQIINEPNDITHRKRNVVIYNIAESTNAATWKSDDDEKIREVLCEI